MNVEFDELAKSLAQSVTRLLICVMLVASLAQSARGEELYVDWAARPGGDGTVARPYIRITDAVVRARADRAGVVIPVSERITIHVAPGAYHGTYSVTSLAAHPEMEVLPIILNVPNLTLSGATQLERDARGLPTGVHQGPETILTTSDSQLANATHTLILVTRTTDGAAGDGVRVSGFDLKHKQGASADPLRTCALLVWGVSDYDIRGNAFAHTPIGFNTWAASGTVADNYFSAYGLGMGGFGGSLNQPAVVTISGNRFTRQAEGGVILGGSGLGCGPLDLGANTVTTPPTPVETRYDRSNPEDLRNLPDTLAAIVTGNDISDNGHFGARLWGHLFGRYTSADDPVRSILNVSFSGNSFARNGDYGIGLDSGFTDRNLPVRFTSTFTGTFENNMFIENGRGAALFSFWNYWSTLNSAAPADQPDSFLRESSYQITDPEGELSGFDYENPTTDPADGTVLNNTLMVNGAVVAPGVKITPQKQ